MLLVATYIVYFLSSRILILCILTWHTANIVFPAFFATNVILGLSLTNEIKAELCGFPRCCLKQPDSSCILWPICLSASPIYSVNMLVHVLGATLGSESHLLRVIREGWRQRNREKESERESLSPRNPSRLHTSSGLPTSRFLFCKQPLSCLSHSLLVQVIFLKIQYDITPIQ